jgi:hypothetical protein
VAAEPGVTEVRLPDRAVAMAGPVTSEGVGLSRADQWIADGKRDAGVKVGIVDVGFGDLVEMQTAGELPSRTCPTCRWTNPGSAPSSIRRVTWVRLVSAVVVCSRVRVAIDLMCRL